MRTLEKVIHWIANFLAFFSIASTAGMLILSVVDVILRKFFNTPIVGASELVQMLNVGTILALGLGCMTNENISVDFVMDKFPEKLRHVIQFIVHLITIVILGIMIWRGCMNAMDSMSKKYVFSLLKVPQWPFILVLALGFVGGLLATVWLAVDEFGKMKNKECLDVQGKEEEA